MEHCLEDQRIGALLLSEHPEVWLRCVKDHAPSCSVNDLAYMVLSLTQTPEWIQGEENALELTQLNEDVRAYLVEQEGLCDKVIGWCQEALATPPTRQEGTLWYRGYSARKLKWTIQHLSPRA